MSQITLRQLPPMLEKQLRTLAKETGTSLNKVVISLLKKELGLTEDGDRKRNLTALCGTWTAEEEAEFELNTSMFTAIDQEIWEQLHDSGS